MTPRAARLAFALAGAVVAHALAAPAATARDHDAAPALPAPSGNVVNVVTEAQLQAAVAALQSNTTIVIAAGTYSLTSTLWLRPSAAGPALTNVAIRGATGDPADVVLAGIGMNGPQGNVPHGIHVGNVNGILIADLTIRDVFYHPIQLAGELGCAAPRIYHCRLIDAGEQFVKGTPRAPGDGVDGGIVEYTLMEYTTTCKSAYTNGVDIHGGAGWTIRHNLFRRIVAAPGSGLAGPAVLMWNRSADTICEGNLFLDCERGIAFGLNDVVADDHARGVIRNNVFHRSSGVSGDTGIYVANSAGTQVLNNTVILSGTYPGGGAIELRFAATTGVDVRYNLCDAPVQRRDGATGTVTSNVTSAAPSWFVGPAAGDLRLSAGAAGAIDQAAAHASVADDFAGASRPAGAAPDMGAFELGASAPAPGPPPAPPPPIGGGPGGGTTGASTGGGGGGCCRAGGGAPDPALALLGALALALLAYRRPPHRL